MSILADRFLEPPHIGGLRGRENLPGEALAQQLTSAGDNVAAVVADEALESQGGDLPRRVKRLIGIGGNAGRRLTDDAVLEAQKVTGDQQGQCRQVETEVAGRMTRTVQDTAHRRGR